MQLVALAREHRLHGLDGACDDGSELHRLARRALILPRVMRETSSRSSTRRVRCPTCRSMTSRAHDQLRGRAAGYCASAARRCGSAPADCAARAPASPGIHPCGDWPRASVALSCSSSRVFSACSVECACARRVLASARLRLSRCSSRRLAIKLHQYRDLAAQDFRHHRDRDVVDRAELVALQPIELADVHAGDEDDRRALEARMLVDQARGLEAIHARHADIEQHHREFIGHQPLAAPRCPERA